jgi:hypothetical protein
MPANQRLTKLANASGDLESYGRVLLFAAEGSVLTSNWWVRRRCGRPPTPNKGTTVHNVVSLKGEGATSNEAIFGVGAGIHACRRGCASRRSARIPKLPMLVWRTNPCRSAPVLGRSNWLPSSHGTFSNRLPTRLCCGRDGRTPTTQKFNFRVRVQEKSPRLCGRRTDFCRLRSVEFRVPV